MTHQRPKKKFKWLRRGIGGLFFAALVLTAGYYFLPLLNGYQTTGTLDLAGLTAEVTVQRDDSGMAYIRAQNTDDLFFAQGFVTAQDRLFQMQLNRMMAQGRISELAGEAALGLDRRMRTIGLHRMAQKQAQLLNEKNAGLFQKYVDGINAFVDQTAGEIPLEFKLAGITPDLWEIADSLSIVFYLGYATAANLDTEIIAQMLLETVGYEKNRRMIPQIQASWLFPLNPHFFYRTPAFWRWRHLHRTGSCGPAATTGRCQRTGLNQAGPCFAEIPIWTPGSCPGYGIPSG
jgi:penicillin G amidase